MGNPQRLRPLETQQKVDESGRVFLVGQQARDRKVRTAEVQIHAERLGNICNVIGWMLLATAFVTFFFSPSDWRAGGHLIEWLGSGQALIGVVLVGTGIVLRHGVEEEVKPKGDLGPDVET